MNEFAHTEFAEERRREKARTLGRALWVNEYSPEDAAHLGEKDWRALARTADTNPPGPETQRMAVQWLAWLWRTEGPPPSPDPQPAPTPTKRARPGGWSKPKGTCGWDGCTQPGRLYPCGWRCDPHSPWAQAGAPAPWTLKPHAAT